jgi:mono/diheme cytochrome c family protein
MKRFLVGFILGILVLPIGAFAYFKLGKPPVATGDPPLPFEKEIVAVPLHARIDREMPKSVPIAADERAYAAGAAVYQAQCAACHGLPDHDSSFAKGMFPQAPQLFVRHGDHVGVSDDEPGESYWKVANGIRLSGMPAYKGVLSENEIWQVTLLVANADKLPAGVQQALKPAAPAK